jgi:hypothetical protein
VKGSDFALGAAILGGSALAIAFVMRPKGEGGGVALPSFKLPDITISNLVQQPQGPSMPTAFPAITIAPVFQSPIAQSLLFQGDKSPQSAFPSLPALADLPALASGILATPALAGLPAAAPIVEKGKEAMETVKQTVEGLFDEIGFTTGGGGARDLIKKYGASEWTLPALPALPDVGEAFTEVKGKAQEVIGLAKDNLDKALSFPSGWDVLSDAGTLTLDALTLGKAPGSFISNVIDAQKSLFGWAIGTLLPDLNPFS